MLSWTNIINYATNNTYCGSVFFLTCFEISVCVYYMEDICEVHHLCVQSQFRTIIMAAAMYLIKTLGNIVLYWTQTQQLHTS